MKCEYCRYIVRVSNENGSYSWCSIFGDDDPPEPFIEEDGCNLKPMEAKKLNRLIEQADCYRYPSGPECEQMCDENKQFTKEELKEIEQYHKERKVAYDALEAYFKELEERHKKYYRR